MKPTDVIWNRACDGGGPNPRDGDRALAALLYAHGLIMNGGVLNAAEYLTRSELAAAQTGYQFFGLDAAARLLSHARQIFETAEDLGSHEAVLDRQYATLIPDDSFLVEQFERHMKASPLDFAAP